MKKTITYIFNNELLSYLLFGIATTLVSILSRLVIYQLTHKELLATALANIIGILFAFITNDTIVFKQARQNLAKPFSEIYSSTSFHFWS